MNKILICITALFWSVLTADEVVIIGGGPAGLATAIEAHESGAHITLVEKREDYVREQGVFLKGPALGLLEKWKVRIDHMSVVTVKESDVKIGVAQLKHIEQGLEKRVQELGIQKLCGEFKSLSPRTVVVEIAGEERKISYDILVGADGAHSDVRESLGIATRSFGYGKGTGALILCSDSANELGITIGKKGDTHGKKISLPIGQVVFFQSSTFPLPSFTNLLREFGWQSEEKNVTGILQDIEVLLQQAIAFSDQEQSAILVGDAAATASFFQGMGANTALQTAALAGEFFRKVKQERTSAYEAYNKAAKEATDAMIDDSRFLFK